MIPFDVLWWLLSAVVECFWRSLLINIETYVDSKRRTGDGNDISRRTMLVLLFLSYFWLIHSCQFCLQAQGRRL